ncbi:MAG TPA: coatomer subunit epsilon [Acidobacteriaceae bacterium]|nr:coatomer subunit epsilon [Acidobacteriaceae bacterium]
MDTQTRHALKQDKFVTATTSSLEWIGEHRSNVVAWAVGAVLVAAIAVTSFVVYEKRDAAANLLLGQAMDIYETPLTQPNQPAEPGFKTYATAADRAKAANPLFRQAADQYGWLNAGEMARYFAGTTELDMGQQAAGEADLEKATHAGSGNLSALAKIALANLYEQTGRSSQAVTLFQDVIAHPTTTVPKAEAQLQLAALYETTQPQEARRLYAEIKDQNKETAAEQIATQKLQGLK